MCGRSPGRLRLGSRLTRARLRARSAARGVPERRTRGRRHRALVVRGRHGRAAGHRFGREDEGECVRTVR